MVEYAVIFKAEQTVYVTAESEDDAIDKANEIVDMRDFEVQETEVIMQ